MDRIFLIFILEVVCVCVLPQNIYLFLLVSETLDKQQKTELPWNIFYCISLLANIFPEYTNQSSFFRIIMLTF